MKQTMSQYVNTDLATGMWLQTENIRWILTILVAYVSQGASSLYLTLDAAVILQQGQ